MSKTVLVYETRRGITPVLVLTGSPGAAGIRDLDLRLARMDPRARRQVLVDLSGARGLDPPALTALCTTLRHASVRGLAITVVVTDDRVAWVLETCAIAGVHLHATVSAALADGAESSPRSRVAAAFLRRLGIRTAAGERTLS